MSSWRPDITVLSDPRLNPDSNRVLNQADILRNNQDIPSNTVNSPLMISSAFHDGSLVFVTHPYRQFRPAIEQALNFNDPNLFETPEVLRHEDIGWDYYVESAIYRASIEAGRRGLALVGPDLLVPELFKSAPIQNIIRAHSEADTSIESSPTQISSIITEGTRTRTKRVFTMR